MPNNEKKKIIILVSVTFLALGWCCLISYIVNNSQNKPASATDIVIVVSPLAPSVTPTEPEVAAFPITATDLPLTPTAAPVTELSPTVPPTSIVVATLTPAPPTPTQFSPTATSSANLFAALLVVSLHNTPSGRGLVDLAADESIGDDRYGWYVIPCNTQICAKSEGYLVGYKFVDILGVEVYIWYIDPTLENIYFVNGKAKRLTPELPGAFAAGIVTDVGEAFSAFENLPKSEALR